VYAAARDALAKDSGQYGSNRGSDALLDAFLAHIAQIGLSGYTRANCATGIGAKHVIYNLAEVLLDEGDTIAFPVPYWTSYLDIAEIVNAKVDLLPCPASQDYKLTPAQLDAALAKKPKVFLFNNPSNPTGMVYTRDEIARWPRCWSKHPDTWIITDDIYNRMVFDGVWLRELRACPPGTARPRDLLDSLSKTYGMPGWRVGFMAGPEVVAKACHDDELQPHHQHPRDRHRRRDCRAERPAGRAQAEERRVPGQARSGDGGARCDSRAWSAPSRRARSTCSRTSVAPSARRTARPA
jgi:aspartate aminotransferase